MGSEGRMAVSDELGAVVAPIVGTGEGSPRGEKQRVKAFVPGVAVCLAGAGLAYLASKVPPVSAPC